MWLAMLGVTSGAEPTFTCVGEGDEKGCFGNFADPAMMEGHDPFSAEFTCRDWCTKEPCKALSGNLTQECMLCSSSAMCHPKADDFDAYKGKTSGNDVICRESCKTHQCIDLNGNPKFECGGCVDDGTNTCHPGSEHFDDWMERRNIKDREL